MAGGRFGEGVVVSGARGRCLTPGTRSALAGPTESTCNGDPCVHVSEAGDVAKIGESPRCVVGQARGIGGEAWAAMASVEIRRTGGGCGGMVEVFSRARCDAGFSFWKGRFKGGWRRSIGFRSLLQGVDVIDDDVPESGGVWLTELFVGQSVRILPAMARHGMSDARALSLG